MIDRRNFNLGIGALAVTGSAPSVAQTKRVIRAANPNQVLDASQAFATCGRHPRLGYYAVENIDLEYVNMSSITQVLLAISTGQADTGSLAPALYLPAVAKEPQLGVIAAYKWLPRNANVVVVKPDSSIRSVQDLAGKKIGIRNQGDGGIAQLQLMYTELGLPTTDINFVAVGDAGTAGNALKDGTVDAFVTFDTAAARIEAVGFAVRYLPLPPNYAQLGSGWFGFRKKDLKEDRKSIVGFCRAMGKSTLFAYSNLPQALSIHWALYPDSKPKGKSDEEARKEVELILGQRRVNWIRRENDPDQRWGASTVSEWQTMVSVAAKATGNAQLPQQIGDLSNVFTNELIDEINNFDKAAIVRQAREFKL